MLEEKLHAEADAHERPAFGHDVTDDLDQPELMQAVHRCARGANTRKDNRVGESYFVWIRRDGNLGTSGFQRASN